MEDLQKKITDLISGNEELRKIIKDLKDKLPGAAEHVEEAKKEASDTADKAKEETDAASKKGEEGEAELNKKKEELEVENEKLKKEKKRLETEVAAAVEKAKNEAVSKVTAGVGSLGIKF